MRSLLMSVVVIGDSGVGKSNLMVRYTRDKFAFENTTIAVELDTFTAQVSGTNGKRVKVSKTARQTGMQPMQVD